MGFPPGALVGEKTPLFYFSATKPRRGKSMCTSSRNWLLSWFVLKRPQSKNFRSKLKLIFVFVRGTALQDLINAAISHLGKVSRCSVPRSGRPGVLERDSLGFSTQNQTSHSLSLLPDHGWNTREHKVWSRTEKRNYRHPDDSVAMLPDPAMALNLLRMRSL